MNKNHQIDIPIWTILKIILVLLGLALFWFIRDVILLLFITWVLVTILYPTVERLNKNGLPRILSAVLIYILFFLIVVMGFMIIVPPLNLQIQQIIANWPDYTNRFYPIYENLKTYALILGLNTKTTANIITPLTGSIYGITLNFLSSLLSILVVLVLTFYTLIQEDAIKHFWVSLLPTSRKNQTIEILDKITKKWGAWIRGRILLSLAVGLLAYITLLILQVPFALTLAVLVALLDFVPFIGPLISTFLAVIIAYTTQNWLVAILILVIFFLIQQLESYVLEPKIMQKAIGISPITIIVSVLIGAKLLGLIGIVLAVPIAAGIAVIFEEWRKFKKLE